VALAACADTSPVGGEPAEPAAAETQDDGSRPGAPSDDGAGPRPGAPFDIEAFENLGGPLDSFRETAAGTCTGGACTVTEEIVEDPGAAVGCEVRSFAYDPPVQPEGAPPSEQFMQRGTHVTAVIACPPDEGSAGDGEGEGEEGGDGEDESAEEPAG
jgi:hypothetical protein